MKNWEREILEKKGWGNNRANNCTTASGLSTCNMTARIKRNNKMSNSIKYWGRRKSGGVKEYIMKYILSKVKYKRKCKNLLLEQ